MSTPTKLKRTLLVQAREKKGWTQRYLADLLEVSLDTVRQWERGRHLPYQATIQKLCQIFDKTPEQLGLLKEQSPSSSLENKASPLRIIEIDDFEQQTVQVANLAPTSSTDSADLTMSNESTLSQTAQGASEPSEEERKAAWEMYIELVTRVPVAILGQGEGLLHEALSSLYSLFPTTRAILRRYGPAMARNNQDTHLSFSSLMIRMLNTVLRPLLSKWHPLLQDYEATRPDSVSVTQHERCWERYTELRQEMSMTRKALIEYATIFAQMAGVSQLITDDVPEVRPRLLRADVG
jgi:transcriptional regulator with XRE-family HTH domain